MASELKPCQIADALEKCDWAGASIGNKAIVSLAIEALRNTRPAPAATDTGLETVTYRYRDTWEGASGRWIFSHKKFNIEEAEWDELVTRSQSEAIIAAERAKNETQAETIDKLHGIITKLEADNAAKDARIKELEAVNENREAANRYLSDVATKNGDRIEALETILAVSEKRIKHWIASCAASDEKVEALEAKLAAAEKALEPFALEAANWCDTVPDSHRSLCTEPGSKTAHPGSETTFTVGDLRRARAVLGGTP